MKNTNINRKVEVKYAVLGQNLDILENIIIYFDENNKIIEIEEKKNRINNNHLIIPGLFNSHVHAADIGLRGVQTTTLEELVGSEGIKHIYLSGLTRTETKNQIEKSFTEAINAGTYGWSDFREGGLEGINIYPIKKSKYHIPFGRPLLSDIEKMPSIAHIGFRSVQSFDENVMKEMIKKSHHLKKKVFIHASEGLKLRSKWIREKGVSDLIWAVDELKVDAIIHITHANHDDITKMEEKRIDGVICLTSNQYTKTGIPPIKELIEANLQLGIGTDNAMFSELGMWHELKSLSRHNVDPRRLLSMATIEGANICGLEWGVKKGMSNILKIAIPKQLKKNKIKQWLVQHCNSDDIIEGWRDY